MKKKIIFAMLCVVAAAMMLSMMIFTPQKKVQYIQNDEDIMGTISLSDTQKTEKDTYEFTVDGSKAEQFRTRYIVIQLDEIVRDIAQIQIYVDEGQGYQLQGKKNISILEGEQYGYAVLDMDSYRGLRIQADYQYAIATIEFHTNAPQMEVTSVTPFKPLLILGMGALVVVFFLAFFLQGRFDVLGRMKESFITVWNRRKNIFTQLMKLAIRIGLAGFVAYLISIGIHYARYGAWSCHTLMYIWTFAGILVILIFMMNRKQIEAYINRVVFLLIITIGGALIVATPASHKAWDIDSHYRWALIDSYLGRANLTQADLAVIHAYDESLVGDNPQEYQVKEEILNKDYQYVIANDYGIITLPHMLAGMMMAVVRFFGGSFTAIFHAGEWGNLILYAILCYLAMKRLKSGKMILAVVALFPTNLMIAANYSYDYWILGFSMVGFAYFLGNCQEKGTTITTKDTVIMVGALALACIPKEIYIMFLLVPFLMPKSKIENKKKYYSICLAGFGVLLFMLLVRSLATTGGTGDVRGGAVMPADQIQYIFHNMKEYAQTLTLFLKDYLDLLSVKDYTVNFAYYGVATRLVHVIPVLIIYTAITDKQPCDSYETSVLTRIYAIVMYVATAALIATALYITYTPVAELEILGCQPRYLIPLIYPLAAMTGSSKIASRMDKGVYYYGVTIVSTLILYGSIYDVVIRSMVS